jgi:hypothetical protein
MRQGVCHIGTIAVLLKNLEMDVSLAFVEVAYNGVRSNSLSFLYLNIRNVAVEQKLSPLRISTRPGPYEPQGYVLPTHSTTP